MLNRRSPFVILFFAVVLFTACETCVVCGFNQRCATCTQGADEQRFCTSLPDTLGNFIARWEGLGYLCIETDNGDVLGDLVDLCTTDGDELDDFKEFWEGRGATCLETLPN